jgi:hypothetical protein
MSSRPQAQKRLNGANGSLMGLIKVSIITVLLCIPTKISKEGYAPRQNQGRVSDQFKLSDEQRVVARKIEKRLRELGFSDNMIVGAIANAHAESRLNPSAVGDKGKSRGIFQLHKSGLGKGMKQEDMHDITASIDRIAHAARKSKRLMNAEKTGASVEEHTRIFCEDIMRPSHKKKRSRQRVMSLNNLKNS